MYYNIFLKNSVYIYTHTIRTRCRAYDGVMRFLYTIKTIMRINREIRPSKLPSFCVRRARKNSALRTRYAYNYI